MRPGEPRAELDELREEIAQLHRAVGCLGVQLFQLNPHRAPFELREAMGAFETHAASRSRALGSSERRIGGGIVTNSSMDAAETAA